MSMLVLKLPDGTSVEIPLDKERITLGRRGDNDVCLPNLAVSGEHAAVVTILHDSFLEDLRSTNGTLVNGTVVTKHFLRDGDVIDIGQHELVYQAKGDGAVAPGVRPTPAAMGRDEANQLAKPFVHAAGSQSYAPMAGGLAAMGNGGATVSTDGERDFTPARVRSDGRAPRVDLPAAGIRASTNGGTHAPKTPTQDSRNAVARMASVHAAAPDAAPPVAPVAALAVLKILSGALAGRTIPLTKPETTIGRAGMQVASILAMANDFRLKFVEGVTPPSVNGQPFAGGEMQLKFGDVIEIALTRLELSPAVSAGSGPGAA